MFMNQAIKQKAIDAIFAFAIIIAIIKGGWIVAAFFLPKDGIDKITVENSAFYDKYKFAKAFSLLPQKQAQGAGATTEAAPVYKLENIELQGTFVSKELSFVTIKDGAAIELVAKNEAYKGYKLIEVLAKKAVFEKDGARYEISLEKEDEPKAAPKADILGDDVVRFISRPQVAKYASDFNSIWKHISIKEIVEKGELKGFRVTKVDPASIFGKLGLLTDDIIIGANNQTFKTYSDVFKIYKNINQMDSLKLKVLRGNQEKELEYEIFQ